MSQGSERDGPALTDASVWQPLLPDRSDAKVVLGVDVARWGSGGFMELLVRPPKVPRVGGIYTLEKRFHLNRILKNKHMKNKFILLISLLMENTGI